METAISDPAAQTVPVSMLSGFLGAGKTTLLRHLLQNTDLKIGCIVNDVASVNIDAKLLRNDTRGQRDPGQPASTADLADTIELANGCACCSISDELFTSFDNLLAVAARRGIVYDRIVLENSGVAEPQNIREQFAEAAVLGHPVLRRVHLDTLFTVVDSATFVKDFSSRAPLAARPELGDGGGLRPVVDLLVEQVECADCVVLNKLDQVETEAVKTSLHEIVASLNPLARVVGCTRGVVPVVELFGRDARPGLMARLNVEGQHRGYVAAAKAEAAEEEEGPAVGGAAEAEGEGLSKKHKHGHGHGGEGCHAAGVHPGAEHNHAHAHGHGADVDCAACKHPEGGYAYAHEHGAAAPAAARPRQATSAARRFGIVSFVYSRRRPFHPQRLKDLVLRWMPVSTNKALGAGEAPGQGDSPIKTVLRSKGFMWMANSHSTAYFWSHAGQHFEIRDEGEWWAAVPDADWPANPDQLRTILADFGLDAGGGASGDATGAQAAASGAAPFGDRRQEVVFIGAGMDREAICAQLDSALLSEAEMQQYVERYQAQPDPVHAALQNLAAAAAAAGSTH